MFTCCPHCETVFRIQPEQLRAAHGKVRCSECNRVFNALEDLRPSDEAEPEPPRLEARVDTEAPVETPLETAPAVTGPAEPQDEGHHELLEDLSSQLAARGAAEGGSVLVPGAKPDSVQRFAWAAASLALVLLMLLQLGWWLRAPLLDHPDGRRAAELLCSVAPCSIPPRRDTGRFAILHRAVSSHPSLPNTLQIALRFTNQASFPQPYPGLRLTLYGEDGAIAVRRAFAPQEYLTMAGGNSLIASGDEVAVALEALDPGEGVIGFEFEFY